MYTRTILFLLWASVCLDTVCLYSARMRTLSAAVATGVLGVQPPPGRRPPCDGAVQPVLAGGQVVGCVGRERCVGGTLRRAVLQATPWRAAE